MDIATELFSVTVVVKDQDRALAFYRDVLGLEVQMDTELWPGARLVQLTAPGSPVPIALLTEASGLPLGVRYVTPHAEAAHRALREAGVEPHTDVLHTEFAPPMFTFSDPEGNTVILIEPSPTDPSPTDEGASLPVAAVLAAVPVSDTAAAAAWYERLFGRPADATPMPALTEWHHPGGVLQLVLDRERAGGGLATLQLADLAAAVDGLRARGLDTAAQPGTAVTAVATIEDPDGNALTLVQT